MPGANVVLPVGAYRTVNGLFQKLHARVVWLKFINALSWLRLSAAEMTAIDDLVGKAASDLS